MTPQTANAIREPFIAACFDLRNAMQTIFERNGGEGEIDLEMIGYREMKKRFAIGIDPGQKTGVAWYDREKRKIILYKTSNFWDVYRDFANEMAWRQSVELVIEVPTLKRIYARNDDNSDVGRVRENMSNRMGSNRREAELLAEGLESVGYDVRRVKPTRTKWTAKDLQQRTGIRARTNEHVRDAIALVWGL